MGIEGRYQFPPHSRRGFASTLMMAMVALLRLAVLLTGIHDKRTWRRR